MITARTYAAATVALVGLFVGAAHAADRTPTIGRVLETADAVVVGAVPYGTVADISYSFALVPERVLKGSLKPGVALEVRYDARSVSMKGTGEVNGYYGLWFLKRDAAKGYTIVPPGQQSLPLEFVYYPLPRRDADVSASPAGASVAEQVLSVLAGAVDAVEPGQSFRQLSDGVLRCIGVVGSREVLLQWSRSELSHRRALGLVGLVMLEDAAALARAASEFESWDDSYLRIRFGIVASSYRNPDPDGVRVLGELATRETSLKNLKMDALRALRSIHTKDALPYLAKFLESEDAELRGQAVAGFTYFVNNWPIETPAAIVGMAFTRPVANAPYRTVETDRYNSLGRFENAAEERAASEFWKNWWAEHKATLSTEP